MDRSLKVSAFAHRHPTDWRRNCPGLRLYRRMICDEIFEICMRRGSCVAPDRLASIATWTEQQLFHDAGSLVDYMNEENLYTRVLSSLIYKLKGMEHRPPLNPSVDLNMYPSPVPMGYYGHTVNGVSSASLAIGNQRGGVEYKRKIPQPLVSGESEEMPRVIKRYKTGDQFKTTTSVGVSTLSMEMNPSPLEESQFIKPANNGLQHAEAGQPQEVSLPPVGIWSISADSELTTDVKVRLKMGDQSVPSVDISKHGGVPLLSEEPVCLVEDTQDMETTEAIQHEAAEASQHEAEVDTSQSICQLCKEGHFYFAPPALYCSSCEKVINYGGNYFTPRKGREDIYICSGCYGHKTKFVSVSRGSILKSKLEKKRHDEGGNGESWVQCDLCDAWNHEICALFNNERNVDGKANYICPRCCEKAINKDDRTTYREGRAFSARDLPRTKLSDHIEGRLHERLRQDREDRAKASGNNFHEVPAAEDLVVRVLLSINRNVEVNKQFMDIFKDLSYPSELPYKSKVIALFQKIEGVDVLLYAMYVQEYGSDCSPPNNRSVYVSYLDSVKYFRPDIKSATGESLRTFVYYEIMLGYLEYCKKHGFLSCHLWSCPPNKGDDFLFYCHPKFQKNPPQKLLRKWYGAMFRRAADENIVTSSTNLSEFYLAPSGSDQRKITAARLPYFEGDYWSSNLGNFLKEIDQPNGEKSEETSERALRACKKSSTASSYDNRLMEKIGEKMKGFKEDFMVSHLQFVCTACREVILSGKRWFCDRCCKQKPQLCERCYYAGKVGRNADGFPVCKAKHLLTEATVDPVPCDTEDGDITIESELLENRSFFLEFCMKKNYQFDTLRRAKHSSMMILYSLSGRKDSVAESSTQPGFSHNHELAPSSSADVPVAEVQIELPCQADTEMLDIVVHCTQCIPSESKPCSNLKCSEMKELFHHCAQCSQGAPKGCKKCQDVWDILQLHAEGCVDSDCHVPHCRLLRGQLKQPVKHGTSGAHRSSIST